MTTGFVSAALPLSQSFFKPKLSLCSPKPVTYTTGYRAIRMIGESPIPEETVSTQMDSVIENEVATQAEESSDSVATLIPPDEDEADDEEYEPCTPPQPFLNQVAIKEVRDKFKIHETDSGSPEFQIATLTARIAYLTNHLRENPKDFSSTRGLLKMVATRRRLLKYLKKQDRSRFDAIISGLNIRVSQQLRSL